MQGRRHCQSGSGQACRARGCCAGLPPFRLTSKVVLVWVGQGVWVTVFGNVGKWVWGGRRSRSRRGGISCGGYAGRGPPRVASGRQPPGPICQLLCFAINILLQCPLERFAFANTSPPLSPPSL